MSARQSSKILMVFGKEDIVEYSIKDLIKEINIIGKHLQEYKAKRVTVYFLNSVEFLVSIFSVYCLYNYTKLI